MMVLVVVGKVPVSGVGDFGADKAGGRLVDDGFAGGVGGELVLDLPVAGRTGGVGD